MGAINLNNTGSGSAITLSSDGSSLLLNGSAVGGGGGGADLYAANESSPQAQPSATGTNAVAIGDDAVASGERSFAAMLDSEASGTQSIAIGRNALSSGSLATAIGYAAKSAGSQSVALGQSYASGADSFAAAIDNNTSSYGATGSGSIAIGHQAKATGGYGAVAIGRNAQVALGSNQYSAVALGQSYASGQNSFAAGGANSSSSYGAKAENAIAIGSQSMSQSTSAFALGSSAQVYSGGLYGYAIGRDATVSNDYGYALGYKATTRIDGQFAFSGTGQINGHIGGTAQSNIFVLKSDTTDATAEALTTDNATATTTNQIVLQNESAMTFTGTIVVREDASDGDDYAGWEIKGVIMRQGQASDTTLGVGIVNDLYHTAGLANAAVALSADTTNGGLKIQVTGIASTNLNWVATVHTSEVVNT